MAAAFAAVNPWSITLRSAMGSTSMAAAAISKATRAIAMRPRYGARNGSSDFSGFSDVPLGRSEEGLSEEAFSEVDRAEAGRSGEVLSDVRSAVLTELEFAQVQFPP